MFNSDGRRFLDWILIISVFVAFTWFRQGAPPSAPVVAAIIIAAAVLTFWAPNRIPWAARFDSLRSVLFVGAILGFLASSQALQMAGDQASGGLPFAIAGIVLLTFAAAMFRMLGWPAKDADKPDELGGSASTTRH